MPDRNRPPETGTDKALALVIAADRREPPPALVLAPLAMLPGVVANLDLDREILAEIVADDMAREELERVRVYDPPSNDARGLRRVEREERARFACIRALKLANRRFAQLQRVVTETRERCGPGGVKS